MMQDFVCLLSSGGKLKPAKPLINLPLVSVVIPCYNYGRFLEQCVASVTALQPAIELDIIIVDDCSTDGSLAIARKLQFDDPRIRVISHSVNKGHIATYNEGLEAAVGEYVLLLSADDLVAPGALSRAAALLAAEPTIGLVYGRGIDFVNVPPNRSQGTPKWIVWRGIDWLRARCRSGYNVVSTPTAVMRTSALQKIGGYRADLPHAGDFEMWLRTASVSDIGFLAGVDQAFYRCHGTNMNSRIFKSGTATGKLIDMQQRLLSFEAVFSGLGSQLSGAEDLLLAVREVIARQAFEAINDAYARGRREFPYEEFEVFARDTFPRVEQSRTGRALARRKRLGLIDVPLHPLWAPRAIAARVQNQARRWRHYTVGV